MSGNSAPRSVERQGRKSAATRLARIVIGTRRDWRLERPRLPRPSMPRLSWVGPLAVVASLLISWPAFSGAVGEDGSVSFGLFVGAVSIMLMSWSFVLALRLRVLESIFGGLDTMYRVHRWSGSLAVVAMYLHTSVEAEIEGGIRGPADRSPRMPKAWPGRARPCSTSW